MATLSDIKKRIGSVKNTQKITRAMKMVAAAKLRRAQMAVIGSRPYSEKLNEVVMDIVQKSKGKKMHALFVAKKEVKKIKLVIFSSNKGLCGGFNSNLLRRCEKFIKDQQANDVVVETLVIGKKGRDYLRARNVEVHDFKPDWASELSFDDAVTMIEGSINSFQTDEVGAVYLAYNQFQSAIAQEPFIDQLMPLVLDESSEESYGIDYIFEPTKEELLETLLPKYLAVQVYKAHLESLASELGARMTAMDSATNNASDMISSLSLQYNRARQASITTELMDIVNGAESIK